MNKPTVFYKKIGFHFGFVSFYIDSPPIFGGYGFKLSVRFYSKRFRKMRERVKDMRL